MRDRRRSERWGRWAERFAAVALMAKGYRIVARNWRMREGEVDIIARRGSLVLFVEVKARATEEAGRLAVSRESESRIENAGRAWIARQPNGAQLNHRNDLVIVRPWRWPLHLENAW